MADRAPETGRVCLHCQRRVPRGVAKCRCGAVLSGDAPFEQHSTKFTPIFASLLAVVALGTAGYWTFIRQPVRPATQTVPAAATPLNPTEPPPAAPATRELSSEQRAWDAAAQMQDAPPAVDSAAPAAPAPAGATGTTPALEEMVGRAMPAIVLVETTGGRGSAFFVERDTLITNVHVVEQDSYVTLRRMDGSSVTARVQTRAPAFDIAVLKVSPPSPSQAFLPMGSTTELKPGQEVIVIGSALGTLQNSVSRGIVSGLRNSGGVTMVQSDAAANPGNSGGPMLDRNGRVVGILTGGYRGQEGLNFAVAIDHARDILDGRQANLGSGRAGLGNIQPVTPGGEASESGRRQQQGEQEFLRRVAAAEQAAPQLESAWQRFRSTCFHSPIRGSYDREWFAMFTPGAIPGDAASGCADYYRTMQTEMNKFRDYLHAAVEDARRANVLPGTVRDALRARRLNHDW